MATPLTDAINALTTYANEITGKSDTTLSAAVGSLADGYGGGDIGGLSQMVDVSNPEYTWGYFFSCLKNGATVGGRVTYTSAFPNTETKILETGLTTVHGIMFARHDVSLPANVGGQPVKTVFIFVDTGGTLSAVGMFANNFARIYGQAQGTVQSGAPLNGAIRIDGGDIYYTGRYNKNAAYQMLQVNAEYEWLAW